jgi:hypothetical protein
MTRRKAGHAPRLIITLTDKQWAVAKQSSSGGCLIADALKEQHPNLTKVTVDMATIRATDRERGERYTWLTPGPAQHVLLSFDQGWSQPTEQVELRNAVKVQKVTRPPNQLKARQTRFAALEAKEATGETTPKERASLHTMRETDRLHPEGLPSSAGPVTDVVPRRDGSATVVGGPGLPKPTPEKHPNLLAGRDRHFGAKLAHPGVAFQEAVDKAVAQHLASAVAEDTGGATSAPGASATTKDKEQPV